ncbi:hypothetical protein DFJ58DRAFT_844603 [Suillus subalutaceus]|uniref:uncharacterized protein n=1 Tax=Suillus subalutaceus TaxID=48586 RepID=UPI001B87ED14|nr:uncharacterized protein DFJ58DRAFT_844603 [Suillus subalutaceus]KAG1842634.1 hypothetical protein DFJ58DRAFT_844603 [Suillus subalutaceus]
MPKSPSIVQSTYTGSSCIVFHQVFLPQYVVALADWRAGYLLEGGIVPTTVCLTTLLDNGGLEGGIVPTPVCLTTLLQPLGQWGLGGRYSAYAGAPNHPPSTIWVREIYLPVPDRGKEGSSATAFTPNLINASKKESVPLLGPTTKSRDWLLLLAQWGLTAHPGIHLSLAKQLLMDTNIILPSLQFLYFCTGQRTSECVLVRSTGNSQTILTTLVLDMNIILSSSQCTLACGVVKAMASSVAAPSLDGFEDIPKLWLSKLGKAAQEVAAYANSSMAYPQICLQIRRSW